MSEDLITVFGATGAQGGSLINSILKSKRSTFALRGITRDVGSNSSMTLASRGVEMRQANCFVKDQVVEALKGSWGVFANTNSEDPVGHGRVANPAVGRFLLISLQGCYRRRGSF